MELPQLRMLRMMLMGVGNYQYIHGTIAQMCIYAHQKERKHVIWQMLQHDVGVANEEMGEISFALLSRCIMGDTIKHQSEHMQKMYRLLPLYRMCANDFEEDLFISGGGTGYVYIKKTSPEVEAVVGHMKSFIRKICRNVKTSYPRKCCGKTGVTLNKLQADGNVGVDGSLVRWYQEDVTSQFLEATEKMKTNMRSYKMEGYDHIWHHMPKKKAVDRINPDVPEEHDEQEGEEDDVGTGILDDDRVLDLPDDDIWSDSSNESVAEEDKARDDDDDEDAEKWEVSKITGDFIKKKVHYVIVKWKGYQSTTNETLSSIKCQVPDTVSKYFTDKRRIAAMRKKRRSDRLKEDPTFKPQKKGKKDNENSDSE
jgi:hypothetical protein